MDYDLFSEGFFRLTKSQQVFVTEELTQIYWEVLQQLNQGQWAHTVRVALEDPDPPQPGKMWPTGVLLGWGRSYVDPNVLRLPPPSGTNSHPTLPRNPGEHPIAYAGRLAAHMGLLRGGATAVREMPEGVRLPYRDPGEEG